MKYSPDAWHVVRITSKEHGVNYRVLAGWYGGYCGSDSWKMNSGITRYEFDGKFYRFHGSSGSLYECHKDTERLTGYTSSIFASYSAQNNDDMKIELVSIEEFEKEFTSEN